MGILTKGSTEKICKYALKGRERCFQKGAQKELLSQIPKGFTIAVQDESIFVHDIHIIRRKLWLPKGIRPVVTVTGSHQRTCVFGTLTVDRRQLFRQYDMFNQDTFLDYLKQVKKRLGKKVVMFTDRARQHQSNKVKEYLKENKDSVRILYLPKGSPEFNAVEEC